MIQHFWINDDNRVHMGQRDFLESAIDHWSERGLDHV
jgi:hypothetical protein